MTGLERATRLVNKWTSQCLFLNGKEQATLLIRQIAEAIDKAEQDAYERGGRVQAEESEP